MDSEDEPDTAQSILDDLEECARECDASISQTVEFLIQKCESSVVMHKEIKSFDVRKEDGYCRTSAFPINNGLVSGRKYGFDFQFKQMLEIGRIDDRPAVKAKWKGTCDRCTAKPFITTIHEGNGRMHIANHSVDEKRKKHARNCPEYPVRR